MKSWTEQIMTKRSIVIDTETTGLDSENDEILQVSIISSNEDVLFDSLIRPVKKKVWPKATKIHGITPEMVRDAPTLKTVKTRIEAILKPADMVVGYNPSFDLEFLHKVGIFVSESAEVIDVMRIFAEIYGEWNDYFESYTFQPLWKCAKYYHYDWNSAPSQAHNSLADCYATLYCWKAIHNQETT